MQCLFPVTSGEIQVIGFRISYAKIIQSVNKVPVLLVELIHVVDDSFDVKVNDGLAAGGGFEEAEVFGVVVGVVFPDIVTGEVEFGCLVDGKAIAVRLNRLNR